jgi:hypothetical protein
VVKKVFGRLNVPCGEHFRDARTNAAHIHDLSIEAGHNLDANPSHCRPIRKRANGKRWRTLRFQIDRRTIRS